MTTHFMLYLGDTKEVSSLCYQFHCIRIYTEGLQNVPVAQGVSIQVN